jgi:hypothetical protein
VARAGILPGRTKGLTNATVANSVAAIAA